MKCHCGRAMVIEVVPGAKNYPRRLACPEHGYYIEKRSGLKASTIDADRPNDYLNEIASPADVLEISQGEAIDSAY